MNAALALLLWAAPAGANVRAKPAASGIIAAAPGALPSRLAPLAPARLSPLFSAPTEAPFPAPLAAAPLGAPGPGVTPAHAEAVQRLADETGRVWFVHGSRQTGVRFRDGMPFTAESDLDLGVVGSPEAAARLASARWDGVPDARHGPTGSLPTVEEALGKGHLIFKPRAARLGSRDEVDELAAPLRTEVQLSRLQERPRAPGQRFRFTVIGDAEPGRFWFSRVLFGVPGVFRRLLRRADASGSDFIVQLGDLVSRGVRANFRRLFKGLRDATPATPFLTIIGNHDRHAPHGVTDSRLYRRYWGATDWVLDRGDWRFIALDTSAGRLTDKQLAWLDSVLVPGKRFIVFTHIPPAPLGEFTDFGALKGVGGFKRGAARFMSLMSERRVERVYMGHIHGLGVVRRGGVTYVLTGGGGSPLYPVKIRRLHHALEVEVGPDGIHEIVRPLDAAPFVLR